MTFVLSFTKMCVSRYVPFNILLSIPSLFIHTLAVSIGLCLVGVCTVFVSATLVSLWKYASVEDLSLQAGSKVTFEDVERLGECCPNGDDDS